MVLIVSGFNYITLSFQNLFIPLAITWNFNVTIKVPVWVLSHFDVVAQRSSSSLDSKIAR